MSLGITNALKVSFSELHFNVTFWKIRDNAVGYIHALVLVSKWDVEKATEAAKDRYRLDIITMAVVSLKYKASVVDFIDSVKKAITQYTIEEIDAHVAKQKDNRSENIKAADRVLIDSFNAAGIQTHLTADPVVKAPAETATKLPAKKATK